MDGGYALLETDSGGHTELVTRVTYIPTVSTLTFEYMSDEALRHWDFTSQSLPRSTWSMHKYYVTPNAPRGSLLLASSESVNV